MRNEFSKFDARALAYDEQSQVSRERCHESLNNLSGHFTI